MIIVNTDYIPGKKFTVLGMVEGATVRAKHIGKDIMSGLKTIVGGEIKSYKEMMDEARELAKDRMAEKAKELGADAIVNVRYATSQIMQGAAEIMVYGTAVKFID